MLDWIKTEIQADIVCETMLTAGFFIESKNKNKTKTKLQHRGLENEANTEVPKTASPSIDHQCFWTAKANLIKVALN